MKKVVRKTKCGIELKPQKININMKSLKIPKG
jgi:hypothetical protein